jgi:GAF domain-containing protein
MHDDEFSSAKSVMHLKVSSVICVPLLDRGRLLGLIYVGNDSIRDLFQEETLRVLTVFASQAALIVANALLLNELRHDNKRLNDRLEQYRFGEIAARRHRCNGCFASGRSRDRHLRADHRRDQAPARS